MAAVGADTDGVELHIDDRVRDEMLGLGTVKGSVTCVGGGCNLLIDWDVPPPAGGAAEAGRGGTHLTFVSAGTGRAAPAGATATVRNAHTGAAWERGDVDSKTHQEVQLPRQVHRWRQGTGEPAAR
eukprot:2852495-Prymnesium_polylepis.1